MCTVVLPEALRLLPADSNTKTVQQQPTQNIHVCAFFILAMSVDFFFYPGEDADSLGHYGSSVKKKEDRVSTDVHVSPTESARSVLENIEIDGKRSEDNEVNTRP